MASKSSKIYSVLQKHHHQSGHSDVGQEEELNDIEIKPQFSRAGSSGNGGSRTGISMDGGSTGSIALPRPTTSHKTSSGPLTSKANSSTSSNMTASVVVNLPTSCPSSDIDYASPTSASPSSPVASSDHQPEVRISFL